MSLESSLGVHDGDYNGVKTSSSSPEPPDGDRGARHRRNYQACDRCRSRKVKCDLGPVDNPRLPPCARCRRERVECKFAKQRKKEKGDSEERDEEPGSNKRRRVDSGDSMPRPPYDGSFTGYERGNDRVPALDPTLVGMQPPTSYPMRPSPPSANTRPGRGTHEMYRNPNTLDQKTSEVHSSAAGKALTSNPPATTADSLITLQRAAQQLEDLEHDPRRIKDFQRSAAGGPAFAAEKQLTPEQKLARERCLIVWRSARFVRAGWFTAEEAMLYVEYFYQKLQPMTPVDVTEFRPPGKHLTLLTEEPVLAVTILTISSRYMRLTGRSSDTRAHKIHERLWASLMEQIQRLFWGQEQFGGGFTGAGVSKVRESASGQITWPGSLRTLGTIEALLLLSDWQPRSLHFPPDDDDNHLLNLDYDKLPNMTGANGNAAQNPSLDTLPYASWLEPAWRSDKMCWMLMGLAQALSSELGIDLDLLATPPAVSAAAEDQRKYRIRRMVQVYVAQISGRNGIPCSIKLPAWENSVYHTPDSTVDHTQELFVHIASIMNRANREIFPSRQFTRELTKGTEYRQSIATFAPLLDSWMRHFTKVEGFLVEPMRSIILMEYEYARLYINSLGMQNVVDMWMRTDPQMQNSMSSVAKVVSENKRYIHEVTDASVHILEIVSDVLGSGYYLRDAPVRVFLRCLSAMMFALKRMSLGNHEKTVRKSLDLLDRVCVLLSRDVVDDVHLCAQTSVLIQKIVGHIKTTLIRVQKPANTSGAPSREGSRSQTPHHTSMAESGHTNQQTYEAYTTAASHRYPHDPLAHVTARPMADLMDQTFIAPPNYNFQTNDFDNFMDTGSLDESTLSENPNDWVAMPLDNLLNNGETNVDQGFHSIGPMVGSRDMLELLTNQDYVMQDFGQLAWTSPTTPYQGFTSPHL